MKQTINNTLKNWFGNYLKQFSLLLFYRVIVTAANLVAGIIIARTIGEANRGIYGLFLTSLLIFNTILNLGFNTSVIYFAKKSTDKLKSIVSFYFLLSFSSALLILLTLILFSSIFKFQHPSINFIFIIAYFFLSMGNLFRSIIVGYDQTPTSYKIDAGIKIFLLIVIVALKYLNVLNLYYVLSLILIENLLFYILSYQKIKLDIFPLELDFKFLQSTITFNLKNYFVAILLILLLRSDQYFIKAILGNYYVGLYSVNASIIENLGIIGTLFSIQMLPKLIAQDDFIIKLQKSIKPLILLLLSSLSIAFIFYLLAPMLITLYFKTEIPIAVSSFRILLIGFVFWTILNFIHVLYLSIRVKKTYMSIMMFALLLNIVLNKYLVPAYGIIGSAWASSISYGVLLTLSLFDLFVLKRNNALKKLDV